MAFFLFFVVFSPSLVPLLSSGPEGNTPSSVLSGRGGALNCPDLKGRDSLFVLGSLYIDCDCHCAPTPKRSRTISHGAEGKPQLISTFLDPEAWIIIWEHHLDG